MSDDADDLHLLRLGGAKANEDMLADCRLAGKGLGSESVVDDYASRVRADCRRLVKVRPASRGVRMVSK